MDNIIFDNKSLDTLVAITEEEHVRGLMFMEPAPVMCFPFKKANVTKFWMMNTPSPLDIVFCRNNKIIYICAGVPYSLNLVGPDEPVDLVVELPRGMAKKLELKQGSDVKLKYSTSTLAKKYSNSLE